MPKIDEATKQQRLDRIQLLLTRHPRGLTEAEIAEEIGLERRTVNNYLRELEYQGKALKDGLYWVPLNLKESRLRPFDLSPEEAVTLYLGARLLAKQHDKRNEPAETALLKLAAVLKADAGVGDEIEQAARELAQRPVQEDYQPIFRDVVRGYIYRKKLELTYRPLNWDKSFTTIFSPYLIEPSPIGFSTYLIGHSSIVNALRAYKLERIEAVRLTRDDYAIPPDFPGLDILRNAWSIVMGDKTITVTLRFSPQVKERVLETRWHPSQETSDDPDKPGWLRWQVQVADTMDLLPWVRGWGADCEVLEPEGLRQALEREVRKMAKVYGITSSTDLQTIFFAHRRDGEDRENWQPLIEHLRKTAEMARDFGEDAKVGELAYIAGLTHDLGKYSAEFQKRLDGGPRVDHSTAGAKELKALLKDTPQQVFVQLLVYPIMGHHTGLPDYGNETNLEGSTVCARLKNSLPPYYDYKSELDLSALPFPQRLSIRPLRLRQAPDKPPKDYVSFSFSFLTRMVYSALVDADFQETQEYMRGAQPRGGHDNIPTLCTKMDAHLKQFENPTSAINRKRSETLQACIENGKTEKPGFFSLTVPTGGGKTLASMAFALHHAVEYGLKRIIYVIPFTTIIEQNANKVFKPIFGEENVLEHHSNFDWEGKKRENPDDRTNSALAKLKLAAENWDIPIVVTTNVQFFESLFANKSSRCRKLHNIAKSIIIFDEAQMLPREYMRPAMAAVWELVTNYGASAVFCTATQPGLERFLPEQTQVKELASNPQALFDFYKRVEVKHLGTLPDEDLLIRLNAHNQALCIVNTRRHASGLFGGLHGEGNFHLSTLMCPAHRRAKLAEIEERLKSGQPCRVVSTTVMEAGIDVDFPVGYRALAGLDSINQAAGRVNREMKRGVSEMFIFEPKSEFIKKTPSFLKQSAEVARMVLRDHAEAPISIPAIQAFFGQLYNLQDPNISFDYKNIMGCFDSQEGRFSFEKAARDFQIIEDPTETVIIPYNEDAKRLIEELKYTDYPFSTLRKLQPYTVSIFTGEFEKLSAKGVILTIDDTYHFFDPEHLREYYKPDRGLLVPESGGGDAIFP